jgi:hypothetical protein
MNSLVLGATALWIAIQPWQTAGEIPALRASADYAADMKELAAIDRLVGSWDLDVAYYHDDGRVEHRPGEWHFAWILDGRTVQDVWRVPATEPRAAPRGYGTTIRAWDPDLGAWRGTWVSELSEGTTTFIASAVAGEIVMESQGEEEIFRWIFSDITPESFRWRAVRTADRGRSWQIVQERDARRRHPVDQSR